MLLLELEGVRASSSVLLEVLWCPWQGSLSEVEENCPNIVIFYFERCRGRALAVGYFSRHARVERTPSSAASDFDLDFDREGHEFHSCQSASNTRNPESAARRYAQPRCHPERSMRIRFMDPHAQSKSLPRAKPRGSLPCCSCLSRLREFSRNRRAVGAVA